MGVKASRAEVVAALRAFVPEGAILSITPAAGGHIHESYVVEMAGGAGCFLQRVNTSVIVDPEAAMENIVRVTDHLRGRMVAQGRVLTPLSCTTREYLYSDGVSTWRAFELMRGVKTHLTADSPVQAERTGQAFGMFHRILVDFPPPRLIDTIPDFHCTPSRFEALEASVAIDFDGRAESVGDEIAFARLQRPLASKLAGLQASGAMGERVVHNDAKIANVLFDAESDEPVCIVDLDTVMPGLTLHDFGDMVRSTCCRAAEDEMDLARVEVSLELFEGLTRGYLSQAGDMLTVVEREYLVTAAEVITYEQGLRFLTDYLQGDSYYRTQRPLHNRDRARAQFALLRSIQRHRAQMERIVLACLPRGT